MIGVIANPSEVGAVREFFELFKTPWEWCQTDKRYEVLLCAGVDEFPDNGAELVLLFSGRKLPFDPEARTVAVSEKRHSRVLLYREDQIPIYGGCVIFRGSAGVLVDRETGDSAIHVSQFDGKRVVRLGYDLFGEVQTLLTAGQPVANAGIPTLELHIALLRDLIVSSGVPLAEIPPVPEGYQFIACLTHDVDHPSLRWHKFDHTTLGFLYRAVLGSIVRTCRGRLPARNLLRNWAAAARLPLVHLGLAKDFWYEFDRYVQFEAGLRSTFFVIPNRNYPGRRGLDPAPSLRAARYGAADISAKILELMSEGCEVGAHGIDAWLDSSSARAELEQIRRITGMEDIGVRMHWLYFDEQSPIALDQAGADYDSTIGYNETVGYRAGTTQVYKPFGAVWLLELPLHVMDTALFFSSHLALSPNEARSRVAKIIENAAQFGGTVTVNWHDRSIAPERCWGDFYIDLVNELKTRGAWFATAAETVSWFRYRRSATFESPWSELHGPHVKTTVDSGKGLPGLQLRLYNARQTQPGWNNSYGCISTRL